MGLKDKPLQWGFAREMPNVLEGIVKEAVLVTTKLVEEKNKELIKVAKEVKKRNL